jgi:anti-anti-sigma regulatory factor
MDMPPFTTSKRGDGRTLAVSGSIEELAVDDFRRALHDHVVGSADAVIDLSDVDFLPSMAIGALVGVLKHAADKVTLVAREGSRSAKLLRICGLPFEYQETSGVEPRAAIHAVPPSATP